MHDFAEGYNDTRCTILWLSYVMTVCTRGLQINGLTTQHGPAYSAFLLLSWFSFEFMRCRALKANISYGKSNDLQVPYETPRKIDIVL